MVSTPTAELNATVIVSNHRTVALIINEAPPFGNPFRMVLFCPVQEIFTCGFERGDHNTLSVALTATEPLPLMHFFIG
jgi:hypothetical protein